MSAIIFVLLLLTTPFIYLANQNFQFFQNLAIDSSPTLMSHLEREQQWFNIATVLLLLFLFISNLWFAHKFVQKLQSQALSFDRHLKHLIRGEWHIPPLRVRDRDDFKNLVEQYGYFYKSIQAMTKAEIQILEKMKIDPSQRENYTLWKLLLQQKRSRLGYEELPLLEKEALLQTSKKIESVKKAS